MPANVYLPDGSKKIVVPDAKVQDYLANGYIDEAAWRAKCDAGAAAAYADWMADPATVEERFAMLRQAREAKIAATDYLMTVDYPIDEETRAQVAAYRQALRDLPAQDGAPWDGGRELTPWPATPQTASVI